MKIFLQAILICCFIFASGQKLVISGKTAKSKTFHFDFLVYYSTEIDGETREVLGYINSKNQNYAMKIIKYSNTDIRAKLYSEDDKQTFNFKVKESISNGEVNFDFTYQDSFYLGYQRSYNQPYSFTKVDDNTLRLDVFTNKKRKKILESHTMKIGQYSAQLYPAYQFFFVHHSDLGGKMNYPENIFVEEAVYFCEDGKRGNAKLQEIRKINFDLAIP